MQPGETVLELAAGAGDVGFAILERAQKCVPAGSFSLGAYLSILCRDDAPFLENDGLEGDPRPAFDAAFGENPYLAACQPWAVPPATEVMSEPLGGNHPLLVLTGEFDAFVPHTLVAESLSDRPDTYVFRVPAQTHNVLGFTDCTLAIRNAWGDHPEAPPADTSCLDTLKVTFADPS